MSSGERETELHAIPEAAIRPSSGALGLPVARTAKIRPSLVRMYVPKKHEEDCEQQTMPSCQPWAGKQL